jgi:hypothetical protein
LRIEIAAVGRRRRAYAKPRLTNAEVGVSILAELILERGHLGSANDVEPRGIHLVEIVTDVRHGEPIDAERRVLGLRRQDEPH